MEFAYSEKTQLLMSKLQEFMDEHVYPNEDAYYRAHAEGPDRWQTPALMEELKEKAKKAGLWNLFLPESELGGGLTNLEYAPLCEIMGRVGFASEVFNCAAPDTGNMEVLERYGNDAQKKEWLEPLLEGRIRSAFAMTEPAVASSDATNICTEIRRDGDDYVINGRKWLITGATGASLNIVMAATLDEDGKEVGATMFLCDADQPGIENLRTLDTIDRNSPGGHCVLDFRDVRVAKERVLGEVGKGFRYAQVRLAPARLTHCMRWQGAARRSHDIAVEYARERRAFGKPIGEHQGVGFQLADNEMDLHLSRLAIWHCAWVLDQGERGRKESSQSKVFCSEALSRVVDRSLQVLGGKGITGETVVEQIYRDIRCFRIYDGPSEVHRFALARDILRGAN